MFVKKGVAFLADVSLKKLEEFQDQDGMLLLEAEFMGLLILDKQQ